MTQKKNFDTKFMVELALMIAIIIIMSLTPLGYIRTPGLSITLLTVPVAVGAVLLGPTGGAICGLAFGLTSFYMALTGESAFSSMLLSISPIGTVVEGWLSGLLFKVMYKGGVSRKFSYFAASLACPLLNTLLFMSSLCIFFYNTEYIQGMVSTMGVSNPFLFVIAFVGMQGLIEAVLCFVVASVVSRALFAALKR